MCKKGHRLEISRVLGGKVGPQPLTCRQESAVLKALGFPLSLEFSHLPEVQAWHDH